MLKIELDVLSVFEQVNKRLKNLFVVFSFFEVFQLYISRVEEYIFFSIDIILFLFFYVMLYCIYFYIQILYF